MEACNGVFNRRNEKKSWFSKWSASEMTSVMLASGIRDEPTYAIFI